jgi:hypothetical protein
MSLNANAISESTLQNLQFLRTQKVFLGREFLTWLWFYTETHKHQIRLAGLGEFKLYLDDKITLSSASGCARENSLKGGTPAYAAEARTALLFGKLVSEAKFVLQDENRQWLFSIKAEDLSLRQVRLPSVKDVESDSYLTARLQLLNLLVEVVDSLYKEFVTLKKSENFNDVLENIRQWIDSKQDLELH